MLNELLLCFQRVVRVFGVERLHNSSDERRRTVHNFAQFGNLLEQKGVGFGRVFREMNRLQIHPDFIASSVDVFRLNAVLLA